MTSKNEITTELLDTASIATLVACAKTLGLAGWSKAKKSQRDELLQAILDTGIHKENAKRAKAKTAKKPKAEKVSRETPAMPSERKLANAVNRCSNTIRAELREQFAADMPKTARRAKVNTAIARAIIEAGEVPESIQLSSGKSKGEKGERLLTLKAYIRGLVRDGKLELEPEAIVASFEALPEDTRKALSATAAKDPARYAGVEYRWAIKHGC